MASQDQSNPSEETVESLSNRIAKILDSYKAEASKSSGEKIKKKNKATCEFHCDNCARTLTSKRNLSRHQQNNHCKSINTTSSANQFRCGHCSSTFKFKRYLQQHAKKSCKSYPGIQVADGEKLAKGPNEVKKVGRVQRTLFACQNCRFTTPYVYNIRRHYRVHTDERPYKCPNLGCDYRTRWVHDLFKHQKKGCRGRKNESKTNDATKGNSGSDIECGNKTQVTVESSSSMAFACMLCDFIGDSELSALKHSRQHKSVVILLNRI